MLVKTESNIFILLGDSIFIAVVSTFLVWILLFSHLITRLADTKCSSRHPLKLCFQFEASPVVKGFLIVSS